MNWLDAVLAVILVVSAITSFRKGLSREIIGLASVLVALISGIWLYGTAASYLQPYISSPLTAKLCGFFLVFLCVILLGSFVSFVVGKFLRVTGLSIFDHALGAVFGIVRGVLVAVALVMGIMAFQPGERAPAAVVGSRMAPYVVDTARVFAAMAPHELKEGFHRTYAQVKTAWGTAVEKGTRIAPKGEEDSHEKRI